jgi:hypothetical protein
VWPRSGPELKTETLQLAWEQAPANNPAVEKPGRGAHGSLADFGESAYRPNL